MSAIMKSKALFDSPSIHIGWIEMSDRWEASPIFFTQADGREIITMMGVLWDIEAEEINRLLMEIESHSMIPCDHRAFVEALHTVEWFGRDPQIRIVAGMGYLVRVHSHDFEAITHLHKAYEILEAAIDELGLKKSHVLSILKDLVIAGCRPASLKVLRESII